MERSIEHGLEASCGSLDMAFPWPLVLLWGKLQNKRRVYCIVGDERCRRTNGKLSTCSKYELSNLTLIIDHNITSHGFLEDVLPRREENDLQIKMKAFDVK